MATRMRRVGRRKPLLRVILAEDVKSSGGEGKDLTIRMLYLPAVLLAAVLLACAAALLALSEKAEATFPGKNGKIAYVGGGIYTINPGGVGNAKVANGETPAYAPNGKRIAYSSWDGHDSEIYTIRVGGGGKTQVTHNITEDFYPAYSPDGKKIAYAGSGRNDSEIYTINVGGGDRFKVTNNGTYDFHPSFSPDGKKIAYDGNDGEIYTINTDGTGKFNVTNDNKDDYNPIYAPKGKKIAYVSYDDPDSEIYTINAGGGGKFKVTNNGKDDDDPSYSPNGKKIAYTGYKVFESSDDEDFDSEIYTINIGGGGKSQVTNSKYSSSDPSWGSRP